MNKRSPSNKSTRPPCSRWTTVCLSLKIPRGITASRWAPSPVDRPTQPELQKASLVMRAQSYRRRMFAEFDKVKDLLLP